MSRIRALGALGIGLSLAVAGTVPASANEGVAAAPDCGALSPVGTVFDVTASGDSGPGTFAQAVLDANAQPGTDTIRFAAGLAVTVSESVRLTESVVIDGGGATVTWAPATLGTDSWIRGADGATVSLFDLGITQTNRNWEPIVSLVSTAPGEGVTLCALSVNDSSEGLLSVEMLNGDLTVQDLTVDGSSGDSELAALWLGEVYGSVRVADSVFRNLDMAGLTIDIAELTAEQHISVTDTLFTQLAVSEAESPGLALSLDTVEHAGADPRSTPAVEVTRTHFSEISGFGEAAFYAGEVQGDVLLSESSFRGVTDPEEYLTAAVALTGVQGGVEVLGSQFLDNEVGGLRLESIELAGEQSIRVAESVFSGNTAAVYEEGGGLAIEADVLEDRETPVVELVDSSFVGNWGIDGAAALIDTYHSGEQTGPAIHLSGNTFANGEVSLAEHEGVMLVLRPSVAETTGTSVHVVNNTVDVGPDAGSGLPGMLIQGEGFDSVIEHLTMPGAPVHVRGEEMGLSVRSSALGDAEHGGVIAEYGERVSGVENTVPASGALPADPEDVLPLDEWLLGGLADNGGAQHTMLPAEGSPLIDAAPASAVAVDQRGVTRPQGAAPDRGAVEVAEPVVEPGEVRMGADAEVTAGASATLTVLREGPTDEAVTARVELSDGTAVAGRDYVSASFDLAWAAGDAEAKTLTVQSLVHEPGSRTLQATVTRAEGATIGARDTATVTIVRDEATI
ncbi:choice-of-anchor Q domain-containing protein, partial [Leucobacter sp. M11]|uniref:choice-of-anchor Q domain-containing protein n=1 Tax=Leucobacter sp. M11 TaxID=2993565 RepID=UPI002D7F06BF